MRDFNRSRDRGRDRGRSDREMFDAVCDECGDNCKVPFKPTGNKPIFCSHCFENQGGSDSRNDRRDRGRDRGGDRSFSRSGSREREMYSAVCDECGNKCEIPFKPSNDKPIFCSTCFAKKNEGRYRGSRGDNRNKSKGDDFGKQFQAINEKLDQILQTLSSTKSKVVLKKKVASKKIVAKKTVTKKKVIRKKPTAKKKSAKKVVKKPVKKKKK